MKIAEYLTERQGKFDPSDTEVVSLKRLEKIDFEGNIHLSDKPSKTKMIIVQPGDLVISGINVAKGAIAVWDGDFPVTATIHYSSYEFDNQKLNIEYFKKFLKSPEFIEALKPQVKGGIKTEIKPKHLLPLEVNIPKINKQEEIVSFFKSVDSNILDLKSEIENQSRYLTKLKQTILQEAIEGKLTKDWRKENPVIKGNPDYDAEALLEKIREEKAKLIAEGKIKKQKDLPPIKPEEIPFELPEGWVWTRLGGIIKNPPRNGYSPKAVSYQTNVKTLKLGATTWGSFNPLEFKYIDEDIDENSVFWLKPNDILIQRSNSIDYVGVSAIYTGERNEFIYPDLMMKLEIIAPNFVDYIHKALSSPFNRDYYRQNSKGAQKSMPKINQGIVNNTLVPLPPKIEQQKIVELISILFTNLDEQAKYVLKRKERVEQLIQSILKEAFEDKNHG